VGQIIHPVIGVPDKDALSPRPEGLEGACAYRMFHVVKGILTADEARWTADHGADAIVVSNHGGRQLDGAPATCRVLPEVAEAAGPSTEILLDGGIRRGSHMVKALALGARAVLIGRPYVWGLAVGGQAGVERALDLLEQEIVRTMTLLGCPSVAELDQEWVARA
jgi:L-lactate dehydrogenase (cytochrome)